MIWLIIPAAVIVFSLLVWWVKFWLEMNDRLPTPVCFGMIYGVPIGIVYVILYKCL